MVGASFWQCKIVTAVSLFKLMILADIYELFIFAVCVGAFIFLITGYYISKLSAVF